MTCMPASHGYHVMTYHVTKLDMGVAGQLVYQGVVVCGKHRPAADGFGQLSHHCRGDGRAIVRGCTPTWQGRASQYSLLLGTRILRCMYADANCGSLQGDLWLVCSI